MASLKIVYKSPDLDHTKPQNNNHKKTTTITKSHTQPPINQPLTHKTITILRRIQERHKSHNNYPFNYPKIPRRIQWTGNRFGNFNTKAALTVSMIKNLITRFKERGSVDNYPRSNICRPVSHEKFVEAVRQSVSGDLSISTRRRGGQLNMSRTSVQWILKIDLKMFPYKTQMGQKLGTIRL